MMLVTLKKQVPFFRYALVLIILVTVVALFFKSDVKEAREEAQREAELRKEAAHTTSVLMSKKESTKWVLTAPPNGSLSAGIKTEGRGRTFCFDAERNVLVHRTVHQQNGVSEQLRPYLDGPGITNNIGRESRPTTYTFESADNLPVRVAGNKDCIPS